MNFQVADLLRVFNAPLPPFELFMMNSGEHLQLTAPSVGLSLCLLWRNVLFMCFEVSFDVVELKPQLVSKAGLLLPSGHRQEGPTVGACSCSRAALAGRTGAVKLKRK